MANSKALDISTKDKQVHLLKCNTFKLNPVTQNQGPKCFNFLAKNDFVKKTLIKLYVMFVHFISLDKVCPRKTTPFTSI